MNFHHFPFRKSARYSLLLLDFLENVFLNFIFIKLEVHLTFFVVALFSFVHFFLNLLLFRHTQDMEMFWFWFMCFLILLILCIYSKTKKNQLFALNLPHLVRV